jgi:hypothetical protein
VPIWLCKFRNGCLLVLGACKIKWRELGAPRVIFATRRLCFSSAKGFQNRTVAIALECCRLCSELATKNLQDSTLANLRIRSPTPCAPGRGRHDAADTFACEACEELRHLVSALAHVFPPAPTHGVDSKRMSHGALCIDTRMCTRYLLICHQSL